MTVCAPPHPVRASAIAAAILAGGWVCAAVADPPLRRVLLDRRLSGRVVEMVALDGRTITYVDAGGLVRTEPLAEFVALLPARTDGAEPPSPPRPAPALWLTDGQRFAGALRRGEAAGETVRWEHPVFGPIDVPLEIVSRVRLLPPGELAAEPRGPVPVGQDVVTLRNGDRLAGFLESLGDLARIDVDGTRREAPADLITEITLANPPAAAAGMTAWLSDGSIVSVASVRTSRTGELRLRPRVTAAEAPPSEAEPAPSGSSGLTGDDLVAVAFEAADFVALAAIPLRAQRPVGDRPWSEPITPSDRDGSLLWAPDLTIPGPMSAEWTLPQGAAHLGAEAHLPASMWAWGDCELVISLVAEGSGAVELARHRLNAEHPVATISVPLEGPRDRVLRVTLEPGLYGPIQDRVILRRPIVLLSRSPG